MRQHSLLQPLAASLVLSFMGVFGGCSTSQGVLASDGLKHVGGHIAPEVLVDERELFREAGKAFRRRDYNVAAQRYRALILRAPQGRYADVSRYNAGLSLERLGRYLEAVPFFQKLAERTAGSKDAHDAIFRLALCYRGAEKWDESIDAWSRILKPEYPYIADLDRIEAHLRRGTAYEETGDVARSEQDYKRVFSIHRKNLSNRVVRNSPLIPLAHLHMGRLYGALVVSIKIKLPTERMARDLEEKASYFLKAQNHLLDAVRRHHAKHSLAAGHRLGELYESFYRDLMEAEVPDDLTDEQTGLYLRELKLKVRPLIEKALLTYEKNLNLGNRLDHAGSWTKKTRANLERLRRFMGTEAVRDATKRVD